MLIDMWRTTKRQNSTATPVSQPGWFTQHVQKEVCLKEPTSVLTPTFTLKMGGHDGQNYLWAFGRYYWITGITSLAKDLWEIQCKVDVLGSYRGHIRNTQAFVLYDSTPNSEIPDRRLGVRTTPSTQQATAEMPWGFSGQDGSKFVAISGDGQNDDNASACGVYLMDDAAIDALGYDPGDIGDKIYDTAFNTPLIEYPGQGKVDLITLKVLLDQESQQAVLPDVTAAINSTYYFLCCIIGVIYGIFKNVKQIFSASHAMDSVKSAYWLPFDCSDEGTSVTKIALGAWVEDINAKKITSPFKNTVVNVSIPWQYSDWRNVANTEIQLFIPLIGNVNIPASAVKGHSNISIKMNLNLYSGAFSVRIMCGDVTLGSYGANCQMPILIGNSNANTTAITNTIVAGASLLSAGATGGVSLAAGAGVVASGFESLVPVNTCVGGIGGGSGNNLGFLIVCTTICHNTSDNPANLLPIIGTPTNRLKTLSGTGYCQCMQAHMNMAAVTGESFPTAAEVTEADGLLNSGVFLE